MVLCYYYTNSSQRVSDHHTSKYPSTPHRTLTLEKLPSQNQAHTKTASNSPILTTKIIAKLVKVVVKRFCSELETTPKTQDSKNKC